MFVQSLIGGAHQGGQVKAVLSPDSSQPLSLVKKQDKGEELPENAGYVSGRNRDETIIGVLGGLGV